MNTARILVALVMLACTAPAFANKPARTLLLVDDQDVLYRSGTVRVLHPAKRHADTPVIACTKPWEAGAIGWTSNYRDPATGKYQLWYQAFAGDKARDRTRRSTIAYAESKDGINFSKPELGLFDFNGHRKTNIVLIANGGHSDRYGCGVVVDPTAEDPARRYKLLHNDFCKQAGGGQKPGLCVAFSPDGIHWTKHPRNPVSDTAYGTFGEPVPLVGERGRPWVIPLSMADGIDVFFDPRRQVFACYGKMWIDGPDGGMFFKHAMGRSESRDFIHWSTPECVATPDDRDPPHVEFHTTPVFFYNDAYFCLNQILNRSVAGGTVDIELMVSRDGLRWDRPFRDTFFLPRGKAAKFDSVGIFTNATPVLLDDEIRFYYGGYAMGATGETEAGQGSGVGFASIPRDRFAGIRPVPKSEQSTLRKPLANIGQVTLKAIDLSGLKQITVNADATNGAVRLELLDNRGRRIPDFTREDAMPMRGDSLRHKAMWAGKKLSDLPAEPCMIRIHLDNATVYAVTLS